MMIQMMITMTTTITRSTKMIDGSDGDDEKVDVFSQNRTFGIRLGHRLNN